MLYENDTLRGYWANDNTKHFLVVLIYDALVTIRPSLVCEYLAIGSVIYCYCFIQDTHETQTFPLLTICEGCIYYLPFLLAIRPKRINLRTLAGGMFYRINSSGCWTVNDWSRLVGEKKGKIYYRAQYRWGFWMWRRWALKLVALVYTKYRPETGLDWDWARLRDKYFAGNEISPHYLYPVSVCCVIIQGRGKNKKRYICVGRSQQKSGETSLEPFGRAGTERYCPFLRSFSISLMEFSWSCLVFSFF